jgi:hypothetical protein
MCDDCEETPAAYVAYFNKPGGKRWRPARIVATAPGPLDARASQGEPAAVPVMVQEVRHFSCDDPHKRSPATMGAV